MSVTASAPAAAATSATTTAVTGSRFVAKPDLELKNKTLAEIDASMEKIRPRLDAVREALAPAQKNEGDRRTVLRKQLGELREKQAANKKGNQIVLDQLDALNAGLKKKIAEMKASQDKLPFKTTEAVDAQVAKLERQLESGSIKLVEEKRILQEISVLKKARRTVEAGQAQQLAIDADKAAIAELRETIDNSTVKALSNEYNTIQAELDEINKSKDAIWKKRNDLFDERTKLQKDLDALYQRKKAVNDEYFQALRDHQKGQAEAQARKREQYAVQKQQELEEKRLAAAREERELAEIPAYSAEIVACESVYKYLIQFSTDEKRITEVAAVVEAQKSNARQVDTTANVPSGVMLMKKADKVEDVFFVGKSKKSKAPKEKKAETSNLLKVPLAIVEQLVDLKVVVPTSTADLGKTLDALEEKKAFYKANQEQATAENKRKAEERIAKLSIVDTEEGEKAAEATPAVAAAADEVKPAA